VVEVLTIAKEVRLLGNNFGGIPALASVSPSPECPKRERKNSSEGERHNHKRAAYVGGFCGLTDNLNISWVMFAVSHLDATWRLLMGSGVVDFRFDKTTPNGVLHG
jgi:hypothetical protein